MILIACTSRVTIKLYTHTMHCTALHYFLFFLSIYISVVCYYMKLQDLHWTHLFINSFVSFISLSLFIISLIKNSEQSYFKNYCIKKNYDLFNLFFILSFVCFKPPTLNFNFFYFIQFGAIHHYSYSFFSLLFAWILFHILFFFRQFNLFLVFQR